MKIVTLLVILLLSFTLNDVVSVICQIEPHGFWDFPRLDELYMVEAYPRDTALEMAKAGEIDCFLGAFTTYDVDTLENSPYYWNVSATAGFHWCYHGFNCRDYPDHAGEYAWFYNRTNDFELYPLNISAFRLALAYIVGTQKEPWISEIYGYLCKPQYWFIPQTNAFYVNPYLKPFHHNWTKAEEILLANGWQHLPGPDGKYNNETHPSLDDKWIMPNGKVFYDGTGSSGGNGYCERYAGLYYTADKHVYGIFVARPYDPLAPAFYDISKRHVRMWNKFFMGAESDGKPDNTNTACFIDLPDDTYQYVYYTPRHNHDHDIFMLCLSFENTPDYLYDLFHPETYYQGSRNTAGHSNAIMDQILWTIKYWKLKDYEILEMNVGDYQYGKELPACSNFPLRVPTPFIAELYIARCSDLGVYKEPLTPNVDYEIVGTQIHLLKDITLHAGDALFVTFTAGTYHRLIVDMTEMQQLVLLIQWHLFYTCPFETVYTRALYDLYESGVNEGGTGPNPPFEGWATTPGFGSGTHALITPWTFGNIHRKDTPVGGAMYWQCAGNVETLNPFLIGQDWEHMIFDRMFDSLRVLHPYTHEDMPWIATGWKTIPWTDPSKGVENGMAIKIWLRNDAYWQDGARVTAWDVKWNYDFINSTQADEMASLWEWYMGAEVKNDYLIDIYVNTTGMWKTYEYLDNAMLFRRTIWEPWWGNYTGASSWKPWNVRYDAWTGKPAPVWTDVDGDLVGDLTCLFGTGPFILDYWNEADTARLYKNQQYWARKEGSGLVAIQTSMCDNQVGKQIGDKLIPVMTKPFYKALVEQIEYAGEWPGQTDPTNTYTWEILYNNTTVASGTSSIVGIGVEDVEGNLTTNDNWWRDIPSGIYNWTAKVYKNGNLENTYAIEMGYLIGDTNGDLIVNMIDIYTWGILNFLVETIYDEYYHGATPAWQADLNCDGIVNMLDIFWMILQYTKSLDSS